MMLNLLFWILAFVVIAAALSVVMQKNPMTSALCLVVTMLGLAVLFLMLQAYLLAALQVMVYAGAVMVLFLFVIMLLDSRRDTERFNPYYVATAAVVALAMLGGLFYARDAHRIPPAERLGLEMDQATGVTGLRLFSTTMFTTYAYPLELAGLLLLAAMVGLVVLAKRRGQP